MPRQTEYHDALPSLASDEVRCDSAFANDSNASWLGLSSTDGGMRIGLWKLSSLDSRQPPWYQPQTSLHWSPEGKGNGERIWPTEGLKPGPFISSSSAFPSYVSGVHHFWVRFLHVTVFNPTTEVFTTVFNPTTEVFTFHLHEWCMLGVFLLPAFTHLGHECQDLLSSCDGMYVCTDYTSVYTLIRKSVQGMESKAMAAPREKSPLPEAQRRVKPAMLHHAGQWTQHATNWDHLSQYNPLFIYALIRFSLQRLKLCSSDS